MANRAVLAPGEAVLNPVRQWKKNRSFSFMQRYLAFDSGTTETRRSYPLVHERQPRNGSNSATPVSPILYLLTALHAVAFRNVRNRLSDFRRYVQPILHQPSADFFHRSHRMLLGSSWEKRTRTILQLPRALGGDDDEAVRAVVQIIRNGIHRVVLQSLSHMSSYLNSSRSFPG